MQWKRSLYRAVAVATVVVTVTLTAPAQSSACKQVDSTRGCFGPFTGMQTFDPNLNQNVVFNQAGGADVSTINVHTQLPNKLVFAHLQPWFHVSNTGAGSYPENAGNGQYVSALGHVETGYNSDDPNLVKAQLLDMSQRGLNGLVIDWYGPNANTTEISAGVGPIEDNSTKAISSTLQGTYCPGGNCSMQVAIVEDQGSWSRAYSNLPGYANLAACVQNSGDQFGCISPHLNQDLNYINQTYSNIGNAAYFRPSLPGSPNTPRPVVQYFVSDGFGGSPNPWNLTTAEWTQTWSLAYQQGQSYSFGARPAFIFEGLSGHLHPNSNGSFAWFTFPSSTTPDPNWTANQAYLNTYYNTAAGNNGTLQFWGNSYKGFDERKSTFTGSAQARYINQSCGSIWRQGLGLAAASVVPFVVLPTWNDYDEGSELESGIDNCLSSVNASFIGPHLLGWTLAFSDPNGAESTIDHYDIINMDVNNNVTVVGNVPSGTHSFDTSNVSGSNGPCYSANDCWLFVKAVGIPSVKNIESTGNADIHPSTGSVYISGVEQSVIQCPAVVKPGGTAPVNSTPYFSCPKVYDAGSVSITVGGNTKSAGYGRSSTGVSIATALASQINGDSTMAVRATVAGATITLKSKQSGASMNMPVSCSVSWDDADFGVASFQARPVGMSGGAG